MKNETRSRSILKIAICTFTLSLCIVLTIVYRNNTSRRWNQNIVALYHQIRLDESREEASRVIEASWPAAYVTNEQTVVRTPLELGAQNWVLLLDFREDKVAAVAFRTDDSFQRLPTGAPSDKIKKGFRPYWDSE